VNFRPWGNRFLWAIFSDTYKKLSPYFWVHFNHGKRYNHIDGLRFGRFFTKYSRVDVMITIFCGFRQLSAKKLAFFSKTNVIINFFPNLSLFIESKRPFCRRFLGENIKKIITSVPGHPDLATFVLTRQLNPI
jgi:hypothetical protein